jgi:hypothetical protein
MSQTHRNKISENDSLLWLQATGLSVCQTSPRPLILGSTILWFQILNLKKELLIGMRKSKFVSLANPKLFKTYFSYALWSFGQMTPLKNGSLPKFSKNVHSVLITNAPLCPGHQECLLIAILLPWLCKLRTAWLRRVEDTSDSKLTPQWHS